MWNIIAALTTVDAVAKVGDQCVVADDGRGELHALYPESPQTPAVLLGTGWSGLNAIAGVPDDNVLLVVDAVGVCWRVDLNSASPMESEVLASKLGTATQVAVPNPQAAYVLGRMVGRPALPLTLQPAQIVRPWSLDEPMLPQRVVRLDLASGQANTVLSRLAGAAGLAVSTDESAAYVTLAAGGQLLAINMVGGDRRIVVEGLNDPGHCAWLDESRGLLLVVEEAGLAVVDVTSGQFRRVPGCPGRPRSVARVGDHVVVAAESVVASVETTSIEPYQVLLVPPAAPIYVGGYARILVDLGTSSIAIEDLTFDILEGPQFAGLSAGRDNPFNTAHPQVMLLAGPHAGTYTLRASDSGGTQIATMPFHITDQWTNQNGPSLAFTGVNPLYASGGAWGSGVFPQNFTYGPNAVTGSRRIALIFVNTSDATLPAGTDTLYLNSLINGVPGADGVLRSVAAYFNELSDGRLSIVLAGTSVVTLQSAWNDCHIQSADKRWFTQQTLIQSALLLAQYNIDFTGVDTAVFVVASPNGGLPDPVNPASPGRFCWPIASGGTYILTQPPSAIRRGAFYWFKSLAWSAMPAEWQKLDPRRVYETLAHEIGHTLGMWDLYGDSRDIGAYDLMSRDGGLPSLSLPHQVMLGWVDPLYFRTYNFRIENPVLETITLTAAELLGAGPPPPGERAGAIVEVADGWRYYFEYRSRQNTTPADPGPTQVADQNLPEDQQVVGLDVRAGWYHPPVQRKPIRLLADDGDGQGAVLGVGEDYEEPDPTGNRTFQLQVVSADDDRATVRIRYQPPPLPEPPWPNGPDPSIRPWPGGGDWRSPDLWVINFSGTQVNIPWAGHDNMITARVTNTGSMDAIGVRVGFWVKDFTVSVDAPETLLGWATADIPAGSNYSFGMPWRPPAYSGTTHNGFGSAHYCLIARIAPHTQGTPPRGELNPSNNEAQTNYTVVWTASGSPFSRQRIPVQVANPYNDRSARVLLHVEQRQAWYRTYLEHTWLTLAPGEVRSVEAMFECVADEPEFADRVPPGQLFGEPNIVTMVAAVIDSNSDIPEPIGGATIEVRAARAAHFVDLDVSRASASGRVVLATDGSAVPQGSTVALSGIGPNGRDITYQSPVGPNGSFAIATPDFAPLQQGSVIDVLYGGDLGIAPVATSVVFP